MYLLVNWTIIYIAPHCPSDPGSEFILSKTGVVIGYLRVIQIRLVAATIGEHVRQDDDSRVIVKSKYILPLWLRSGEMYRIREY